MDEQDRLLEQIVETADAREGALAFVEKRAPQWGRSDQR